MGLSGRYTRLNLGIIQEFHTRNWSFSYGIVAEPKVVNGQQFDRGRFRNHGQQWEAERRYSWRQRVGAIRVTGYDNRAQMGTYEQALKLGVAAGSTPDAALTSHVGTLKYGTGISFDQTLSSDVGIFTRLGWNDGKTQSVAFTAIDRLASGGIVTKGTHWHRKSEVAGTSFTADGLSAVHVQYLAAGGLDFLSATGGRTTLPNTFWESYHSARLFPAFYVQRDTNPAYNHDRGPAMVYSIRLP